MEECLSNSWKILGQYLHLFQNLEKVQVIALYTKRVCDVGVSWIVLEKQPRVFIASSIFAILYFVSPT